MASRTQQQLVMPALLLLLLVAQPPKLCQHETASHTIPARPYLPVSLTRTVLSIFGGKPNDQTTLGQQNSKDTRTAFPAGTNSYTRTPLCVTPHNAMLSLSHHRKSKADLGLCWKNIVFCRIPNVLSWCCWSGAVIGFWLILALPARLHWSPTFLRATSRPKLPIKHDNLEIESKILLV